MRTRNVIPLPLPHVLHRAEHHRFRAMLVAAAFEEADRMRQLEARRSLAGARRD